MAKRKRKRSAAQLYDVAFKTKVVLELPAEKNRFKAGEKYNFIGYQ